MVREEIDELSVVMCGLRNGSSPIWFRIDLCLVCDTETPNAIAPPTAITNPRIHTRHTQTLLGIYSREKDKEKDRVSSFPHINNLPFARFTL